ncbi:heavy metal sensor histidine kinase [Pseudomonas aeruginosa]|uniref:heavy metal sensor histidine kinase n=1 Tax=Pseudomonas aeruginosa TaxID=287 RepID=UPI00104DD742|nr:heavy metal sensor histidine kinase [Pseudomonas aeruginosa]
MPARRSLTLYAALLFAAVAALVVSAVGFYLYRSVEEAMLRRSDVMVAGRVEHFRNLLRDNLTLAELKARPRLFENMLGNEQDILLLGQPGEAPIVAVNPRHERLPSLRVVAAGQALNPSVVHAALTHDGVPMRVLAAEVLVGGREPLQITAAHLLLGETRMLAQYRDRVIAAVLLAFLGTALLGWLVLRHGLRPLRTLAATSRRVFRLVGWISAAFAAAPAELQQVAQSFNAMLERLDDGYQRLQQFSADLAHEIRTPIGSLMGHGQVALRQPRSNEEYQALIASNQEELERIARMVESILFLARADDVRAAVERSRLDLGEELRRQAEYFEGLAEERGLSLDIQISGQLRADPQLFRRALSNLLANAIRYASAETLIEVRGLRRSGEFLLSVENACDRLPAEPLSRLFDRFYRGDAARSDAQSSGLGLAIVQAIMRLHGGRAEASAPAPGRIRFELAFPAQD